MSLDLISKMGMGSGHETTKNKKSGKTYKCLFQRLRVIRQIKVQRRT